MTGIVQHAAKLAGYGFPVFRLKRGTKNGYVDSDWADKGATTDPVEIFERFRGKDFNIGVRATGFLILDVDNHGKVNGFDAFNALPPLPDTLTVKTAGGGKHYYFDARGVRYSQRDLAPGINVRATNGYVVGPGSEVNGKLYEIENDVPPAPVPDWLAARLQQAHEKDASAAAFVGELDTEANIKSAKQYLIETAPIAVEGAGGYDTTIKVIYAVLDRGVSPETAIALMLEHWDERCDPPWGQEDLEKKVYQALSGKQDPIGSKNPAAGFVPGELPKPQEVKNPSRVRRLADSDERVEVSWLLDDVLENERIGFLAAKSGAGKSFVVIDLILAGALGKTFFGKPFTERFGSHIVASEGSSSIAPRAKAAAKHKYGLEGDERRDLPISYHDEAPNFMSEEGVRGFIAEIKEEDRHTRAKYGVPLKLIVIDTFAQSFAIQNEDSSREITKATQTMDRIAKATGCAVMAVHHFGWNADRMRGSSALRGNVDFVLEIREKNELYAEKVRNGEECSLGFFEREVVTVGTKPDGRPITSCYIKEIAKPAKTPAAKGGRFGEAFRVALDKVSGLTVTHPDTGVVITAVPLSAVREAFKAAYTGSPDAVREAFRVAKNKAREVDFTIEEIEGEEWVWEALT